MKPTHKVTVYDDKGKLTYTYTGTLRQCYDYMMRRAIALCEKTCYNWEAYTWELTYN